MNIPKQYLPVMPYLIVASAQEFVDFAKNVFDAQEQFMGRDDSQNLKHCEIKIGDAVIMIGQASDDWVQKPAGMFIYVPDVDAVYDRALRTGATSLTLPSKQEYGYTAGFEDLFGNHWWIVQGE